ncbi:MAG TPA: electron transfer flavoprotein subunit alpha [Legionellales bacterium]|nr:electron transfer flavoprotein subunit alpha [Legionellales bacterium]
MSTLIWIEHDENNLHPSTRNLITAAKLLSKPITALVAGKSVQKVAQELSTILGIDAIITCEADYYFPFRAEPIAKLISSLSKDFDNILALATTTGKNILPRAAGLCRHAMLSDVIKIESDKTFVHPIYAGNALAKETFQNTLCIMTIRPSAFEKELLEQSPCEMKSIPALADDTRTKVVRVAKRDKDKADLQTAKIVVSGGRGLGTSENFKLIEDFANKLGAAVGASRAAVDAGFVANDYQVGQTGKIVAPDLYIAIGISGAIQHLAGMKDSKVIVAINKDPEAPIFEIATYGLVGDLFQLLPELIKKIEMSSC